MNEFELEMILDTVGVDVPERCTVCPRLGQLVSELSIAQGNRQLLITSSDEAVLIANARAQLTVQVVDGNPGITDERVHDFVDSSIRSYLRSSNYTDTLKRAGELLEEEETKIGLTVENIQTTVTNCPPKGCQSV